MRYCIAEGAVADDCESHGVRLDFVGQVRQAAADDEQERLSREERRARGCGALRYLCGVRLGAQMWSVTQVWRRRRRRGT